MGTSGSTIELLAGFVAELASLLRSFGKFELTIIECDAEIQQVWKISSYERLPDLAAHKFKGGGGTDFTPVFEYVRKNIPNPHVLIFFTDGDGTCPKTKPPYPVLWLLSEDGDTPVDWGAKNLLRGGVIMPVFSENEIAEPDFIESAWSRLMHGVLSSNDALLLPETLPLEERSVLLEKLRQHILSQDEKPAVLEPFSDFRELAYERRPDPTPSQWLWLYTQIGERHRLLPLNQILGIMAGRDALLPFLESVPDKKIWEWFAPVGDVPDESLPYPGIEDAESSPV